MLRGKFLTLVFRTPVTCRVHIRLRVNKLFSVPYNWGTLLLNFYRVRGVFNVFRTAGNRFSTKWETRKPFGKILN